MKKFTKNGPILTSRRRVLQFAGAGAGAVLVGCGDDSTPMGATDAGTSSMTDAGATRCTLTAAQIEGPFFADLQLMRRDIRGGKPGTPLEIQLTILDASDCQPISDAIVDLWQADVDGLYSAFPGQGDAMNINTSGESFLRGIQTTGADGRVGFETIYPGWYAGRTSHLHFKVRLASREAVTSQLFFPDATSATVYGGAAYMARGQKDTANDADDFGGRDTSLVMNVTQAGAGYLATHTVAVNRV